MNSNFQFKCIALLGISAALSACGGGSSGSTASTAGDSGTPAAVAAANAPAATVPTGSVGAATASTPAATSTAPAATTTTSSSTTAPASTPPAAASDTVTLSWTAPDENTNGTALTNLAGYQINYGTSPTALTQKISINTVGVMNYVVSNLSSGTWYFEIVAVNSAGAQSAPSSVVSTTI
jgi:hypothetical protein